MSKIVTTTIASGSNTSGEVTTVDRQRNFEVGSLILDGTYTNTSFDIQVEVDGTFYDVYDTFGNKFNISVADGKHSLPADVFKDSSKLRLKGASNETSERTVKFLLVDMI